MAYILEAFAWDEAITISTQDDHTIISVNIPTFE